MALFKTKPKTETPILLYPPLLEAIFELRWEIEQDSNVNRMRDPSYPMMYGALYEKMKKDFPNLEDLPSTQAHPETAPFVPRHRARKDKNGYPLFQIGPGILTVNDAKGYSWKSFSALILQMVEHIIDLYPNQELPLNFIKSEMRYVNGIRFDLAKDNPLSFLQNQLHTKVELDPEFFEKIQMHEKPNAVGLNLSYALEKPASNLVLSVNLGQFEKKPAFIQQTLIQSFGELVPSDGKSFTTWLEEAHEVAENCFQIFCKDELMKGFCGG